MIYLIGVNHRIQHRGRDRASSNSIDKFINYLKKTIKENKITLIAEEFNKDALDFSGVDTSVAQDVSKEIEINHIFCEPSSKERKKRKILSPSEIKVRELNIKIERELNKDEQEIFETRKNKSFLKRENIWFNKIKEYLPSRILFICGDDHLERFKKLLTKKGYKSIILSKNWG